MYILGRLSKLIFFILEGTDYFGCEAPLVPMRDIILAETVDVVLDEDVPKLSFSLLTDNGEKPILKFNNFKIKEKKNTSQKSLNLAISVKTYSPKSVVPIEHTTSRKTR